MQVASERNEGGIPFVMANTTLHFSYFFTVAELGQSENTGNRVIKCLLCKEKVNVDDRHVVGGRTFPTFKRDLNATGKLVDRMATQDLSTQTIQNCWEPYRNYGNSVGVGDASDNQHATVWKCGRQNENRFC